MGGDDDGKWFVAGGRSRVRKHQDTSSSRGARRPSARGQAPAAAAANNASTAGGLATSSMCPSRTGAASSRGKQAARGHYGSSSNVSTAASSSSGGNRKPPPPKQHPRAGTLRRGSQPGGQAASTSGATTAGRKRARDPMATSGFIPPNKQATGSTRFSYAAAVEGGERVVLVSLDGTALTKEDPRLLGEAVNKWTMEALTRKEYHNVPEVLNARPCN